MNKLYRVKSKTSILYKGQLLITLDVFWALQRGDRVPTPISIEQIIEGSTEPSHPSSGDLEERRKPRMRRDAARELFSIGEALFFKGFLEQQGHTDIAISEVKLPLPENTQSTADTYSRRFLDFRSWYDYSFTKDDLTLVACGYPMTSSPIEVTLEMHNQVVTEFGAEEGIACLLGVEYLHHALDERSILLFRPGVIPPDPVDIWHDELLNYLTNFAIRAEEKGLMVEASLDVVDRIDKRLRGLRYGKAAGYLIQALRLGYQPGREFETVFSMARQLCHDGFVVKRIYQDTV